MSNTYHWRHQGKDIVADIICSFEEKDNERRLAVKTRQGDMYLIHEFGPVMEVISGPVTVEDAVVLSEHVCSGHKHFKGVNNEVNAIALGNLALLERIAELTDGKEVV